MSLIRYLKPNSYIFLMMISCLFAKYIEPDKNTNSQEILNIYKKDREYSRLIEDKLVYFIEGPVILNIYSRKAFPEQSKKNKSYKFKIIVDENNHFLANHNYRKDPKVYNQNHPGHAYTMAGKDVLNIPKGQHRIELIPLNKKDKILIRATTSPFKQKNEILEVMPIDYEYINSAILNNKNERFYLLSNKIENSEKTDINKLSFKTVGPNLIRIISRTTFQDDKDTYYQFKIRKDKELVSTHHMFADISEATKIINKPLLGVSKWRTTLINIPKGEHRYEIELVYPKDKYVLFKIQEDSKDK